MTRIAIGGLWHETNTFASPFTTSEDFHVLRQEEIPRELRGTRTPIGGFLDWASSAGVAVVPAIFAWALPSGIVEAAVYETLATQLVEEIASLRPDGVLLDLHGAMAAGGCEDVEADLLHRLRRAIGATPIGVVLDFHANTSSAFVSAVDAVAGYDTYPHVDPYDRGLEVGDLLMRLIHSEVNPSRAIAQPPLLIPPQAQGTAAGAMAEVMRRAHDAERDPAVVNIVVAAGFPYADVPCAGCSVVVTSNGGQDVAQDVAHELAQVLWNSRDRFRVVQVPPAEAVAQALQVTDGPVVLVDSADNVGGGAPGDGTVLLGALLRAQAKGAVIPIVDPGVVAAARQAGEGAIITADVGGKTDARHGHPVPIRGRVVRLQRGDFAYRGSYMTGRRVQAGWVALLDVEGVLVVVREQKVMPFDQEELKVLGLEPARCRIIVVKSAIAWRAAYGTIARAVIEVDTPGVCTANLETLPYRRVRRPVAPLDEGTTW